MSGERQQIAALIRRAPVFARVEREAGRLVWRRRDPGFSGLLQAIVGQQISSAAAAAIWGRLCALDGCGTPAGLLALDPDALRAAGLSRPKVAHARALATAYAEGTLDDAALGRMGDEEAVALISSVRGLGRWTAEIHLLFSLDRPDVFPAADLALQGAAADLFALPSRPDARALRLLAEPWQPYRAAAARLLWHWWRHLTRRPLTDDLTQAGMARPGGT